MSRPNSLPAPVQSAISLQVGGMMRMPSPKLVPLLLTPHERESLEALVREHAPSQSLALRARILLACAEESGIAPLTKVAASAGVSREMVRKWRARFMASRLEGMADAPRPGAPRKITDEQVNALVTRILTNKGTGRDAHWSTRSMADEIGLSQSSVSRICRAFGLQSSPLRGVRDARAARGPGARRLDHQRGGRSLRPRRPSSLQSLQGARGRRPVSLELGRRGPFSSAG